EGYVGIDVHRGARICAAGHGGQVLLSRATAALLGSDVELRDLGEHRLKDLPEAEWLLQLIVPGLVPDFPPLRSLSNTNLPAEASSLIGRQRELAELAELIERDRVRLVTLTGTGGTGKTRLALRIAAASVERFKNGVFVVSLGSITDPQLVLPTIAQTVGVKLGSAPGEDLARHLSGKSMLLVLDNFEQLLGAAPDVGRLLAAAAQLKVIVTSRERLRLSGEHEYPVQTLAENDAIVLFAERASAADPAFRLDPVRPVVAAICGRLDRLPLAVELAAARVKMLSTADILANLDERLPLLSGGARDMPERQRTLRATIDWSYDLLATDEQQLFRRLAVFSGGCTLESARAVCEATLDTLQSLLDKSLLRRLGDRYLMLETIREYALDRLRAIDEEDRLRERHASYFTALAQEAGAALEESDVARPRRGAPRGPSVGEWFDRLATEHDNLRAALESLVALGDTAGAMRLALGIWLFWELRGFLKEGQVWTERVIGLPDAKKQREFGWLLNVTGDFHRLQGDFPRARELKERSLALVRETGEKWQLAVVLHNLGVVTAAEGDYGEAEALHEEGLALRKQIGDPNGISHALNGLTALALRQHDWGRGATLAEEELEVARQAGGDREELMGSLHNLAEALRHQGDLGRAAALYVECMRISWELGALGVFAECLDGLADVAFALGDLVGATRLWAASGQLFIETAERPWNAEEADAGIEAARSGLGQEPFELAWREGCAMPREQALSLGMTTARSVQLQS
ncbi:MAG: tetratricopeptide repeat protein, partial [Chloroflexi bacterium]